MVVKAINEETKIITTTWFSANDEFQEGFFPASALDRVETKKPSQAGKGSKAGRKSAKR
jgi:hypothetical protein